MRRFLLVLAVVLVVLGGALIAIGRGDWPSVPTPAVVPPPVVSYEPADGAIEVSPTARIIASVTGGALADVVLRDTTGQPVLGEYNAGRTLWTVREPLGYAQTYTWTGTAAGPGGTNVPLAGSFRTIEPQETIRAKLNIADGSIVGIAAPIALRFDGPVTQRAAVERALSVRTSVPVEGAWGWLPDDWTGDARVHWRPREYWPAGTQVTVTADLYGLHYGDGVYGEGVIATTFTIGRSQIVKADVRRHRMTVIRDGQQVADYPASYGLPSDPYRVTRSGTHVVTERNRRERMISPRYGYDGVYEWAVRISNNGEFIHSNPGTVGVQGRQNVTHGCVNLSPANARAYFESAMYGDPVEVTGSSIPLSLQDGDFADWSFSWSDWQRFSALG
jgi:lipoprotein-anchoring transpeptidase ErfK/SrfK